MAILKGALAVIRYLGSSTKYIRKRPDCVRKFTSTTQAMYSSDGVIRLLKTGTAACRHANLKERMPLHLLQLRNWDHQDYDLISLDQIQCIFMSYPAAVQHADRNGCLPLHVACSQPQPRCGRTRSSRHWPGHPAQDDEGTSAAQICRVG
jgi:hypothetical protein